MYRTTQKQSFSLQEKLGKKKPNTSLGENLEHSWLAIKEVNVSSEPIAF